MILIHRLIEGFNIDNKQQLLNLQFKVFQH